MSLPKKWVRLIILLSALFFYVAPASAHDIDVTISGLQGLDLGAFDLNATWDIDAYDLYYGSHILTENMGSFDLGEAVDLSAPYIDGSGIVNLSVLSYLEDLSAQPDEFTLATLTIYGDETELSGILLSDIILSDSVGDPIPFTVTGTNINAVPIPATVWLLGSVLTGIVGLRRRFCKVWKAPHQ